MKENYEKITEFITIGLIGEGPRKEDELYVFDLPHDWDRVWIRSLVPPNEEITTDFETHDKFQWFSLPKECLEVSAYGNLIIPQVRMDNNTCKSEFGMQLICSTKRCF